MSAAMAAHHPAPARAARNPMAAETASAFAEAGIPFMVHPRVDGADAGGLAAAIVSGLANERSRA